jgi:ABC-type multidrug transport system permease subunit
MKKILRKIAEAGKTISSGNFKASQLLIAVPLVILAGIIFIIIVIKIILSIN